MSPMLPVKLLFFVTEDWYFCSHRLKLAIAAKESGYDVVVVTQVTDHGNVIRGAGLRLIALPSSRRSINPFSELGVVRRLAAIYLQERPDIIHHVAIKPVLYGSIAARLSRVGVVVNAIAGLGWAFSSRTIRARVIRSFLKTSFRWLLKRGEVIVQNSDDAKMMQSLGVPNITLIQGSGVDVDEFQPSKNNGDLPLVILVSRLLWDKGIGEFVEASRIVRGQGISARFVLVGASDPENRACVPEETIRAWVSEGAVEWWGRRDNIPAVLAQADIACLPSYYREGIPKSLLEAAASGLPIVTTDAPGCREVVAHGENGLLVPVRDSGQLAEALSNLITDPDLCARMGKRSRELALEHFTDDQVISETLSVYRRVLGHGAGELAV